MSMNSCKPHPQLYQSRRLKTTQKYLKLHKRTKCFENKIPAIVCIIVGKTNFSCFMQITVIGKREMLKKACLKIKVNGLVNQLLVFMLALIASTQNEPTSFITKTGEKT